MTQRIFVAERSALPPGERIIVEAGDTSVGVFNIDGEFYALENRCAHQGGPVCTGKLQGKLIGEFVSPGERVRERFDDSTPVIACPWHGYEYEIRSGRHVGTEESSFACFIPLYEVVVESDHIYVRIESDK